MSLDVELEDLFLCIGIGLDGVVSWISFVESDGVLEAAWWIEPCGDVDELSPTLVILGAPVVEKDLPRNAWSCREYYYNATSLLFVRKYLITAR